MNHEEFCKYVEGLQPGERVVETGQSCMTGRQGEVYISESGGHKCVMWDKLPGENGRMGTSVTHGTRRISEDWRLGFARTKCACNQCKVPCRHMPGSLIPEDLDRIKEHLHVQDLADFAVDHLLVSKGTRAVINGQMVTVPTLVPAQRPDGSCVFLDEAGHCTIHPVAPYGCSHHDMHMNGEEGHARSLAAVKVQMAAHADQNGTEYNCLCHALEMVGREAKPLTERRAALEKELHEVQHAEEEARKAQAQT